MSLLAEFLAITADWRRVFPQQRTFERAVRQALGSLVCLGRRCLTRIIWTNGGQHRSWSAEYFLHSRCRWEPQQLFQPILKSALEFCPQRLAVLGLRFLQASLLVPLYRNAPAGTRALPIRFQEVSRVKRPGKRASDAEKRQYTEAVKRKNLSRSFVDMSQQLRQELDRAGGRKKILVLAADGSFCNRTCFAEIPERSVLLTRARKDAKLCLRAAAGSRRFYDAAKFTPEQVRQDDGRPWKTTKIFSGGKRRKIRYKEVSAVYWQHGAGKRPLRLLVVAPTPYRKSQSKKLYYRNPAYLLTSDLRSSAKQLLQIYFDRWQIEVNHREEKDRLGVGQAQLWNVTSVPKQPVLAVAAYSALLLASIRAFGAQRGSAYAELPRWRRHARRPSCLDLLALLRKEMAQQPQLLDPFGFQITEPGMVHAAAA